MRTSIPSATGQPSPPHSAPNKTPRHHHRRGPSSTHEHKLPTQTRPEASSHSQSSSRPHWTFFGRSEHGRNNGGGLRPPAARRRAPPPPPPGRPSGIIDIDDEPHQDGGGAGDGEPVLRPHAGVDEAPEPGDRRRDGSGVEPGQHVGPVVGARLLRRRRGVRGPGPGPLVPGDPAADLRLRRRVRPAPDGRLRAAGELHRRGEHDRRRHARLRPRQRRRVPRAGVAVRRLRPVVRVRAVVHAAQPAVRPLRNVQRRHQQQPDASGEGVPAADHLRQPARRRALLGRLLPGRPRGALLPEPPQAQVPARLPPAPPVLRRPRQPRRPPQLRRHRAALPGLEAGPGQRRPPVARRVPGPDAGQVRLRDAARVPAVEPNAAGHHLRRARRVLRPRPHARRRRAQPRRHRRPAALQLHVRPPRRPCPGHPRVPLDRQGDCRPRADRTDADVAVRALVDPGHGEEDLQPAAGLPDEAGRVGGDLRGRGAGEDRATDGLPRAAADADEDQADGGRRGGQAQRVPTGDHPARVRAQRGPPARQPAGPDQGRDERQGRHRLHEGRRQALLRGRRVRQADGRRRPADRQDEAIPHHQDPTPIETLIKAYKLDWLCSEIGLDYKYTDHSQLGCARAIDQNIRVLCAQTNFN